MRQLLTLLLLSAVQLAAIPLCEARSYSIELLIFSLPGDSSGSQAAPQDMSTLPWDDSLRLGAQQMLPNGGGRLGAESNALQRTPGYTPLIHAAWRQNVTGSENAKAWYLKSEQDIVPGTPTVEGLVKISVGRYLHAELDLLVRKKADGGVGNFKSYRFTTHRRMRSKELHYIDHPLVGVLIEINP